MASMTVQYTRTRRATRRWPVPSGAAITTPEACFTISARSIQIVGIQLASLQSRPH
jgi:hypothetical protein